MKRIIALFLALSMLFALTACVGDDENTPAGETTGETTSKTESTTESTTITTDGTEDNAQGTTESTTGGDTTGGDTTENIEDDNATTTDNNDKWASVGGNNGYFRITDNPVLKILLFLHLLNTQKTNLCQS